MRKGERVEVSPGTIRPDLQRIRQHLDSYGKLEIEVVADRLAADLADGRITAVTDILLDDQDPDRRKAG